MTEGDQAMTTPPEPGVDLEAIRRGWANHERVTSEMVRYVTVLITDNQKLRDRLAQANAIRDQQVDIIRGQAESISLVRDRLALAEPTHEACSAQVESLQRQLALAEQERDAVTREFGQFKDEQRESRTLLYTERDYLRTLLDGAKLNNGLIHGESLRLQERLALADQALADAGLREERLRAVVGVAKRMSRGVRGHEPRYIMEIHDKEFRSALARLDETPVKGADGQPAPVVHPDP